MITVIIFLCLLNIALAGKYGIELGDLDSGANNNNHGVRGNVSVVNEVTFYIRNFSFDGNAPNVSFWVGTSEKPSSHGQIVPDEFETNFPLKRYENKDIVISLPDDLKISDIKWLSVWCRSFTADFGHVLIPDGFEAPKEKLLPPLLGKAHKVSSGDIVLLDSKTIQINNLNYDGNGPDAFFLVGKEGSPNGKGIKVPDENGRLSRLRGYNNEVIILRLPGALTWFDLKWFAMYCIMAAQNFGEVYIPPSLNIPIDLLDLPRNEVSPVLTNCREIFRDKLLVRWKIVDEEIYIQLEGRTKNKNGQQYLAFGVSGSEDRAHMLNADVVVAFYDVSKSTAVVDDYYLNAYSQCGGGTGACPDVNQGGRHNIVLVQWKYQNGILSVTYKRRLKASEETDKEIYIDKNTTVVAASGSVNSRMEAAKHSIVTTDLVKIDFGKNAGKCDSLKAEEEPKEEIKAWPPLTLTNETEFTAQIGPSGIDRGYTAITGLVGWGIAWWINGLLIPEITVQRGINYTFIVEGGNNPLYPTEYHPFYITNNKEGGGAYENVGKPGHMVYAGVEKNKSGHYVPIGVGRYCEYKHKTIDQSRNKTTFEEFKKTLKLKCGNGPAGRFYWTPDDDTPKLVYYQCFTHRNLGWKIHVSSTAQVFFLKEWILVFLICGLLNVFAKKNNF